MANKKVKYEETFKTCVFLARIKFFLLTNDGSKEQKKIVEKIEKIINRYKLISTCNEGFFGSRTGNKKLGLFADDFLDLGFSKVNPLFRIPGFFTADNANPKKTYQRWCKAFDGVFSAKEIEMIVAQSTIAGNDYGAEYGAKAWDLLKQQNEWTLTKEVKKLFRF